MHQSKHSTKVTIFSRLSFAKTVVRAHVLHPTAWMNKTTRALLPFFKNKNPRIEKINGVILALTVILIFVLPMYLFPKLIDCTLGILFYLPIAAIILHVCIMSLSKIDNWLTMPN